MQAALYQDVHIGLELYSQRNVKDFSKLNYKLSIFDTEIDS